MKKPLKLEKILDHYARSFPQLDLDLWVYGAATVLIRYYLGEEWSAQNIHTECKDVSKINRAGRAFFHTEGLGNEERLQNAQRVVRLAELCHNLHSVEGIETRFDEIASGQTESTFAELEFAGQFHSRGFQIRFKPRSGKKGDDYDLDLVIPPNLALCCELKCRLEGSTGSAKTILNTLNNARKQLPPDSDGLIGVKVPEAWVSPNHLDDEFQGALVEFFRNTSRVWAVVVRFERKVPQLRGGGWSFYGFREFVNPRSVSLPYATEFSSKLHSERTNWTGLQQFAADWFRSGRGPKG